MIFILLASLATKPVKIITPINENTYVTAGLFKNILTSQATKKPVKAAPR